MYRVASRAVHKQAEFGFLSGGMLSQRVSRRLAGRPPCPAIGPGGIARHAAKRAGEVLGASAAESLVGLHVSEAQFFMVLMAIAASPSLSCFASLLVRNPFAGRFVVRFSV